MTKLFKSKRAARKYLEYSGGVLLDFGTSGGSGGFYDVQEKPNGGPPSIKFKQTYAVCDYDEAAAFRSHLGCEKYIAGLIDFDETRVRRLKNGHKNRRLYTFEVNHRRWGNFIRRVKRIRRVWQP